MIALFFTIELEFNLPCSPCNASCYYYPSPIADLLGDLGGSKPAVKQAPSSAPPATGFSCLSATTAATASGFGFMSTAAAPAPAPSSSVGSSFDFLGGVAAPAAAPPQQATGFSFLGAQPSVEGNALPSFGAAPATKDIASAFGDMGLGYGGTSDAPVPVLGVTPSSVQAVPSNVPQDFSSMSAGALKKALDAAGIDHRHCVEKSELVALAKARLGGNTTSTASSGVPAAASGGRGGGIRSAIELGMPNAFELHGLAADAATAQAARSIDQQREYQLRAATAADSYLGGPGRDASAFLAAARRLPISSLVIPTMPPLARLRLRLPASALNPMLREVPPSYGLRDCYCEMSPSAAAGSAAGKAAALALQPWTGKQSVGPRRYFELVLRPDVSARAVLNAVASAGRAVGLDAVHSSARSVLLQQRVTVPTAAFNQFASSPAVTGMAGSGRTPVIINSASSASSGSSSSGGGGGGGWLSGLLARSTTYVNSLSVCIGANAATGERVLVVAAARFLPDSGSGTASAASSSATASAAAAAVNDHAPSSSSSGAAAAGGSNVAYHGRLISKQAVGGAIVSADGGKAAAKAPSSSSAAAASLFADLAAATSGGGGGIQCMLSVKRRPPANSYKPAISPAVKPAASSSASSSAPSTAADDPFGLSAPASSSSSSNDNEDEEGSGGKQQTPAALAERSILGLQPYAGTPPDLSDPAQAADAVVAHALSAADPSSSSYSSGIASGHADDSASVSSDVNLFPGFDDGSEVLGCERALYQPAPSGVPDDWAVLRLSFLDVERVEGASAAPSNKSINDVLSLGGDNSSGSSGTFALSSISDELIVLACEFASALRGETVLAESVWTDALAAAKAAVAAERGEGTAASAGSQDKAPAAAPAAATKPPSASTTAASVIVGAPTATLDDALAMLDGMTSPPPPAAAAAAAAVKTDVTSEGASSAQQLDPFAAQVTAASGTANSGSKPSRRSMSPEDAEAASEGASNSSGKIRGDGSIPLLPHPDYLSAVTSGLRAVGETTLWTAAQPYESYAKAAETLGQQVLRAVGPTFALHKASPDVSTTSPDPPRLDQLPLTSPAAGAGAIDDEAEGGPSVARPEPTGSEALCDGLVLTSPPTSQASSPSDKGDGLLPALPPSVTLTATDDSLRTVYHRAYLITRALAHAAARGLQAAQAMVDLEIARRLARKKRHVALRCASAFHKVATLISTLQADWGPLPPGAALAGSAVQDPGRALLAREFGASGEAALVHASATALKLLGEVVITPARLVFYANVLGFKTKRNIPLECIVCVRRSATGYGLGDGTLTITYMDDEKKRQQQQQQAQQKAKAPTAAPSSSTATTTASAPASTDLFGGLSVGSAAPSAAGDPSASMFGGLSVNNISSGNASNAAAAAVVSVKDAFDDMCEIGAPSTAGSAAAGDSAPATSAAAALAPLVALAGGAGGGGRGGAKPASTSVAAVVPPGLDGFSLDSLSEEDYLMLVSSGGSLDCLSQLHVTPVASGGGIGRDEMVTLLLTLRQMSARPHLRAFGFEPASAAAGATSTTPAAGTAPASLQSSTGSAADGGKLPPLPSPLSVPDYHAWLEAHWQALSTLVAAAAKESAAKAASARFSAVAGGASAAAATASVPVVKTLPFDPPKRPLLYGARFSDVSGGSGPVASGGGGAATSGTSRAGLLGSLSSAGAAVPRSGSGSAGGGLLAADMMDLFAPPPPVPVPAAAAAPFESADVASGGVPGASELLSTMLTSSDAPPAVGSDVSATTGGGSAGGGGALDAITASLASLAAAASSSANPSIVAAVQAVFTSGGGGGSSRSRSASAAAAAAPAAAVEDASAAAAVTVVEGEGTGAGPVSSPPPLLADPSADAAAADNAAEVEGCAAYDDLDALAAAEDI